MANRGRGVLRQAHVKKIDYKQWTAIPSFSLAISADGTFAVAGVSFAVPATVLRSRSELIGWLDVSGQTAGDEVKFGIGLGLVSTDAFTLGATALPDPSGEPEFPWLYWYEYHLVTEEATGRGPGGFFRLAIDTKAMRKVKPGESLVWVVQRVDGGGDLIAHIAFGQTRILIGT